MAQSQRKVLLINPKFQISFMLYSVFIALAMAGLFYVAVHSFFWKFHSLGAQIGLSENHVFFQFLEQQRHILNLCWLAVSLASFVVLNLAGLLLSHRVAGPLHHLREHMQRVARGETDQEVAFRNGDYFPELADAYNEQLKRLLEKKAA